MTKPTFGLRCSRFFFAAFILLSSLFIGQPAWASPAQGLTQDVYTFDSSILPDRQEYTLCNTSVVPNINFDVGGDIVANCQQDFVLIHWYGYITLPVDGEITFQSYADDGFYLDIGSYNVINDWTLKGCSGTTGTHTFESGVSQQVDIWWYEYGGGACNLLYYNNPTAGLGLVPDSAWTTEAVVPVIPPFLNSPTNVQTSVSENNIKVTWDTPEDSGTAVERYAVSWTYDGQPGWGVGVVGNEFTITNLPENKEVTVWVRADNDTLSVYSQSSLSVLATTGTIFVPPIDPPVDPVDPPIDPEPPIIEPVIPEPPIVPEPPVIPEPEPQPQIQEGSQEIPVVIEDLMQVDLQAVDPTQLTEAQAQQLVEAALVVFESAEAGSPEYEQALDALYLAAQQDDIVVDEELASTPVIGAAVVALADAINFLGNIGADISPKVREETQKVVVGAIVVGQIAGTASLSAMKRTGK
jgi:hypothetical protein